MGAPQGRGIQSQSALDESEIFSVSHCRRSAGLFDSDGIVPLAPMSRISILRPACLALWLASLCASTVWAQSAGSGGRGELPEQLAEIVIPRLEFREATVADGFYYLARKARELGASEPGQQRAVSVEYDRAQTHGARITLSLHQVSLAEAVRHTAALGGVRVTFKNDVFHVAVVPIGQLPRLGSRVDDAVLSGSQRALLTKAASLIVPRVEFREATIREAVNFFRARSVALDSETPNPAHRGINLVILPPPRRSLDSRLTMSVANTPLLEILTTVAKLSGSELRVSNAALIFDFTSVNAVQRQGVDLPRPVPNPRSG